MTALTSAVSLDLDDDDAADHVDPGRAESLLLGPLGGLDAGDVRRLSRLLRTRDKDDARAALPALRRASQEDEEPFNRKAAADAVRAIEQPD